MSAVLNFEDLCRLSGLQRPSAVKNWLQKRNIMYTLDASDRPITTEKILNDTILKGRKTEPIWNIGK